MGMFHSSLSIPFSEQPNVLEDFTHNSPASHVVERINRPSSDPFFSVRASETKSFTRVENGVLVSLGNKWTGVSQGMKRFSQV